MAESLREVALREVQSAAGAVFADDQPVPLTFGNDVTALEATRSGVALVDRSHWGRIAVLGDDRLRFLHNQTTNSFDSLQPGQGCDTVFVSSTARTIDLVSVYALDDAVLLLTSPGYSQRLMEWMDRFIFFADKVELKDLTATTATFSLLGPESDGLVQRLGMAAIVGQPFDSHQVFGLNGVEVRVAVGNGLSQSGYTLILNAADAAVVWQAIAAAGAVPLGETVWQQLRVEVGRPAPDHELTEEVNPLEAGLWYTISLSKGCYIGQETIARLHTYRGVKQQLWGIRLAGPAPSGSLITAAGEKVGQLTSCLLTAAGYLGLGYIRTKAVQPGLKVAIGETEGELVALPFVSHEYI
jgi:folate-binding protein YgfZ